MLSSTSETESSKAMWYHKIVFLTPERYPRHSGREKKNQPIMQLHINYLAATEYLSHPLKKLSLNYICEEKHFSKPNLQQACHTSKTLFCDDVCWYPSSALAALCQPQSCLLIFCFPSLEFNALLLSPLCCLPPCSFWQVLLKTSQNVSLV